MIKELYQFIEKETAVMVKNTDIDSIQNKNITKSGCRVYENGYIGISSTFGEPTDETWKAAEDNLNLKIEYDVEPDKDKRRIRDTRNKITKETFIQKTEELLKLLRKEFSEFIFFNKISLLEQIVSLKNDYDLNYINYDNIIAFSLGIKTQNSLNILDDSFVWLDREFNVEKVIDIIGKRLRVYNNILDIKDNITIPTLIQFEDINKKIINDLNGENIGLKTSIFSDKIGKKVFSKNFTLYCDRRPNIHLEPFFDMEGSTVEFDKYALVENGVLNSGFTNKKCAKVYGMPITAGVLGNYDEVPTLNNTILSIRPSGKSIKELIGNKQVILVTTMFGGDFTNIGDYVLTVQASYLVENDEIIGRLPQFNITNNLYDMFGEDFIGVCSNKYLTGRSGVLINMKVKK